MNGVENNTRAYVATRLLLRWDYLYAVTLKTKVFGDYNHARLEVSWITSTRGLLLRGYTGADFFFFMVKAARDREKKGGSRGFSGFSKSGQITHDQSVSFLHIVSWSLCRRPCGSRAQLRALTFLTTLVDSELERLVSLVELELLEDDGDGFDVGVPAEILFLSAN